MPLTSVPGSTARQLAWSFAGLATLLAACEWALRAADFQHARGADRRVVWSAERDGELRAGDGLYQLDPVCLWSPRPGALIPWTDGARINPDGFRGPQLAVERTPGVLRIAVMGGAATLGVGVRWEDTYAARLVQILGQRGVRAEVLCASAEDHTVVQGLERWRHVVRAWRPQVVILGYFGVREHGQAPQGRTDSTRIAEMRAAARPVHPPGLRDRLRLLHVASWIRDACSGVYWQERDLAFIERRLAPTLARLDWPGERRVPYHEYVTALETLLHEIRAEGARPVLLNVPQHPSVPYDAVLDVYQRGAVEVASWTDTLVVDGRNAFVRAVAEEEIPSQDLFLGDLGPSECGHLSIAQALADEMLARFGARR
jgi:hypothetical protein